MKYFLDTEFLEGEQKRLFGRTKPTIDLISIGIVSEDNKEYYAISKDFNLKEAWNRYQMKQVSGDARNRYPEGVKEYWIRENVLKPIWEDWVQKKDIWDDWSFTYKNFKKALRRYGKTNEEIANEIQYFVYQKEEVLYNHEHATIDTVGSVESKIDFYTYYGDYDWVVFCWLFGKMIDLPKGFPMYSKDLKQELDKLSEEVYKEGNELNILEEEVNPLEDIVKAHKNYPKQSNEHNALSDAKWNKELYEFLKGF